MSTLVEQQLDEDDTMATASDYTEDYEAYLSNLENSYDICISIDFICERLQIADQYIAESEDSTSSICMDSAHCSYLLSSVLPKSVEFLCKTDLNNLYDQDIIQYQKTNCAEYTTNSAECREFLVSKIEAYFEFVLEFILRLKPNYIKEFYDVLKDIFMLTHRVYKAHSIWLDRVSSEYRQKIIEESSGKYAECNTSTMKQYHHNYIKLINFFGAHSGFTIILHEMLDGKRENEDGTAIATVTTDDDDIESGPSTLTHHALQCYIIALACIHRFLLANIKEAIAEHLYQAVEHWYLSMSIRAIKQYPRSQIHAILRKLYYLLSGLNNSNKRQEYVLKFEYLRLQIACKWLCTDSLERKITAWKEFKEYIDTTQRKYDMMNNPHKYSNQQLSSYSYCKNPKSVAIYYINCREVAQFLHQKNVLNLFLAEDVHEELLKKSYDILFFLGWYNLLTKKHIRMLWLHSIEKTESFINTVYKVIIDLFNCLSWDLIEFIATLIIDIDLRQYNDKIINLIALFCSKCLYRSTSNAKNTVPQLIAEWHCGLKLLWRAMQSDQLVNNPQIQQLAMTKLVLCLQSDSGAVHQEYCKNLCVENLRCSRSVGTSLRVLQHIINAHPIMPPAAAVAPATNNVAEEIKEEIKDATDKEESQSYFGRESTRSEIIHALEKHHGILTLFFQDLSRSMSAYNPQQEHKTEGESNVETRQIVNFQARFDFLRFILQFSSLRLAHKQLDDLWDIVIGDTLKSEYCRTDAYKLEQNYFFKWLKDICPPLGAHANGNANYSPAISVDDAVNLFHTKLGSMPRKTMTSDSLQCLHQYFDLVYELATKKSAASGASAHPDLSAALDVMWEIAIEAETDTVAQSCGVFILSFYMKPAVRQSQIQSQNSDIESKVSDNILNLINSAAANATAVNSSTAAEETVENKSGKMNKWEGRSNFVEKCMDYIQQQSMSCNYRAVDRCLDLLETFIECTRPGVMRGEFQSSSGENGDLNVFGDESSSDSVIYMANKRDANAINVSTLTWNHFRKTAPWNLGPYAISSWILPIGVNHFIKINVSNLQMQKDTKNFQIMINKYSRVGELQDLIAAILNQDKGLLQMQANNSISLAPQIEANTLESCNISDGCNISVMSIFSLQKDESNECHAPDGAFILSQNRLYIEVLLELLNRSHDKLSRRLWNLLMRLPFNLQVVASLRNIVEFVGSDENNNRVVTRNVNWDIFVDASCTFKLLYSLQIFDSCLQHCAVSWLDAFMTLDGLQHLYLTLINFEFDYTNNVCTYASYRSLYMLFKIFASLTSHELIESDPLFTRCAPRHNTPKIIKIHSVNGVLSKFNHNDVDVAKLGRKIFSLILEIIEQINCDEKEEQHPLLAEIIDLALYQFIATLFFYSSRLVALFEDDAYWMKLVRLSLFCADELVRACVVKHLFQIFVKYNPDSVSSRALQLKTLELMFRELENMNRAENESLQVHYICGEYFKFYGLVIKHYCRNLLYLEHSSYWRNLEYFENGPLQYAYDALVAYRGLETRYNDACDEYLCGLLSLIGSILCGLPTLKRHCSKLMRQTKNELIFKCLFAVCDPSSRDDDALEILSAPRRPPIPKCMTSRARQAAFNLLLEIASCGDTGIWDEILCDLQEFHDVRIREIGDDSIEFGFNPDYKRRSSTTGKCGLHNYGCTCYMNATMQQLYCNPVIRKVVLGVDLRDLYEEKELKSTVFYAMQTMFSKLMWSDRRAIWPEDFLANYRDFEGNKIDPNEQMDAHEFFNFLFDAIERELRGTIAEKMLKEEFCGKEVNQVICQECGYVSETFVPMYAVSCKIQNHLRLEESLQDEFVRGDWLKGGNAYRCSKCDKKVTALKRSCFTSLPATMLVHLQRFEFNLETMLKVKINSELRFPLKLNMAPYTKEYLDNKNRENIDYQLVGITVHSGMADIGHYYSFIKEEDEWFSFNDDYVSRFDVRTMSDECFGGNKLTVIRDSKTNQLVQRWIAKSNNAYILVYRKQNKNNNNNNTRLIDIDNKYLTAKDLDLNVLKERETETEQESATQIIKEEEEHTSEEEEEEEFKINHLSEIAQSVHWNNMRFAKICQLCDMNLVDFEWRFLHLRASKFSDKLDVNRSSSDSIRRNIGCRRSALIFSFVWDVLCKFDGATSTKIAAAAAAAADDDGVIACDDEKQSSERKKAEKLTPIYSWCEFIKSLFATDICSAYQFLYMLTHTRKRMWCRYLLESKNVLVRQCFADVLIVAIKCLVADERGLYYKRESNNKENDDDNKENHDDIINPNRTRKDSSVEWFASASVIVHLIDEMCRLILLASGFWRRLREFWWFFLEFSQIGAQEKQLLLDRHLIIECCRFYCGKKAFEFGLKQFVVDDDAEFDNDESGLKVKYDRRKMGSNDSEPDVANMVQMLSNLICACAPPSFVASESNALNLSSAAFLQMPSADKRLLCDAKIWMKFLEDQQNPHCLAKIFAHLCWRNAEFSRKTCRALVNYLEEYHDNVYQSAFIVAKSLLCLDDYREEENETITIYAHSRIDRLLTPILKMQRDWYRENKYMQSIAKIAQFIDDVAQTNLHVANYFRCKSNEILIQWFQQFLNSHSYYLNLPRKPEFDDD